MTFKRAAVAGDEAMSKVRFSPCVYYAEELIEICSGPIEPVDIVWGANTLIPCMHFYVSMSERAGKGEDDPAPDLRGLPVHLWRDNNG